MQLYTLELPGQRIIVVNSIALAREALLTKKDDFAGRPFMFVMRVLSMEANDIVVSDFSPKLVYQRKIVHSAIRMYSPYLEEKIITEVNHFADKIIPGKPTNPLHDVIFITINVIFAIVMGERYETINAEFERKVELIKSLASMTGPFNILNLMPFLYNFPIGPTLKVKKTANELHQYFTGKYHEHLTSYQDGDIRDLTDALIKARQEADQDDHHTRDVITEKNIMMTMMDVFVAGFETTATMILWFMLFMVKYPDVQAKIHAELDGDYGPDAGKSPRWKDRTKLPYLVATIDETLRHASVAPLLLPHKTITDTSLAGYNIPKDTVVIFNTWSMHQDKNEWKNPADFNPVRFMESNGKLSQVAGAKSFLPFGMGRRVCVGEALAKQELFTVLARLLQRFSLHKASSLPEIPKEITGSLRYPPPYEICFQERW